MLACLFPWDIGLPILMRYIGLPIPMRYWPDYSHEINWPAYSHEILACLFSWDIGLTILIRYWPAYFHEILACLFPWDILACLYQTSFATRRKYSSQQIRSHQLYAHGHGSFRLSARKIFLWKYAVPTYIVYIYIYIYIRYRIPDGISSSMRDFIILVLILTFFIFNFWKI